MATYRVEGWAKIPVDVELEAENKEEAIEYAYGAVKDAVILPTAFEAEEEVDYGPDGVAVVRLPDSDWIIDLETAEEI